MTHQVPFPLSAPLFYLTSSLHCIYNISTVLGGEKRQLKTHEEMGTGIAAGVISAFGKSTLFCFII